MRTAILFREGGVEEKALEAVGMAEDLELNCWKSDLVRRREADMNWRCSEQGGAKREVKSRDPRKQMEDLILI